ncbi:phosphotransferase [Streptomyces iakyrus]|uniref:phosphotransferase n=1 Tax=Streptomyces iakyrus TaxID=68219 RepID=UPI003D8A71C4
MADDLAAEYGRLLFALPAGHLHGDFNVGNVLRDAASRPRGIDLDGFVTGPREWDLMQTAMYYDSFGWHTEASTPISSPGADSTYGNGPGTPFSGASANCWSPGLRRTPAPIHVRPLARRGRPTVTSETVEEAARRLRIGRTTCYGVSAVGLLVLMAHRDARVPTTIRPGQREHLAARAPGKPVPPYAANGERRTF